MPKLALNKSTLHRESQRLKLYRRALPPLDLKRRQLVAERRQQATELERVQQRQQTIRNQVREQIPMLAYRSVDLGGLARVNTVRLEEHNLLGVRLPRLVEVSVDQARYGLLCRPHWVDAAAQHLKQLLELEVEQRVAEQRLTLLNQAVARATQRVNLFEKVLIPRTLERIRRVQIYLADVERAGVVRAKIAKRKRAEELHS